MSQDRLTLSELKAQSPKDLLAYAEELEIENASTMRKGDMMFAILKEQRRGRMGDFRRRGAGSFAGRVWLSALARSELSAGSR